MKKLKIIYQKRLIFLQRNKSLDSDTSSMTEILENFINTIDSDIYVLSHVTSPFLKEETINICINNVLTDNYDSAFTGIVLKDFLWYKDKPLNYKLNNIPRTQDLNDVIKETSGLYVFKKDVFIKSKQRIGFKPYIHLQETKESIDIDNIYDFKLAEMFVNN